MQRSRPPVIPETGILVMLVAALRAASAAPFAASPACPPTAPTMAPKPAPALATPCWTQFPNASKKPCGSEGAGVLVGADDCASGPPVCAVAAMQANTKALNANTLAPARTATSVQCGSWHLALCGVRLNFTRGESPSCLGH